MLDVLHVSQPSATVAGASQESTQASLKALTGKSQKLQSAVKELELSLILGRDFWMYRMRI